MGTELASVTSNSPSRDQMISISNGVFYFPNAAEFHVIYTGHVNGLLPFTAPDIEGYL